ncbi:MAG: sel1 repeat family protein, partial [Bacteroidaceae bacterium]|nr:sel1 repeat family protein [Bacteroidaceae bacterium]
DSIIHQYQFASDEDGSFKIETEEFAGTKGALLTPELTMNQQMDSTYVFSINKFFSPPFAQYNYWQRTTGMPIKDEKRDTAIVKISDYEFMLTEVDIKGKKRKDRYERPPLSEVRFNFLDEWEYAKEKIIERSLVGDKGEEKEDISEILEAMKVGGKHTYIDSLMLQERLVTTNNAARKVPASAVLRSIFERYNYPWAYWVKLIVVKGEYNADSIVRPDREYIHGINPEKMMNFEEIVIRSDIGTRQQFQRRGEVLEREQNVLRIKHWESQFYYGFLGWQCIADSKRHNLPMTFYENLYAGIVKDLLTGHLTGSAKPYNPNYVACFIPYKKQHKGIIPELHTGFSITDPFGRRARNSSRRYTTVKGYNESKQFYSPSYKDKRPNDKKDVRRTLTWVPSVKADGGKLTVELYNSAITQKPIIDVEGIGGSTFYGTNNNTTNRILSDESASIEKHYGKNFINNPAITAYAFKITTDGRNLYREKEYARAFAKFHEAAALGYPDAMLYTGVCYTNGDGVERDSVKAFRMFRSAANGNHIPAMHNLANCYM